MHLNIDKVVEFLNDDLKHDMAANDLEEKGFTGFWKTTWLKLLSFQTVPIVLRFFQNPNGRKLDHIFCRLIQIVAFVQVIVLFSYALNLE